MALTDLTRISTAGIATGTSLSGAILHGDAHFRGTNAGINSAIFDSSENELNLKDNVKLTFGDAGTTDSQIHFDGQHLNIKETSPTGGLFIDAHNLFLRNPTQSNEIYLKCNGQAVDRSVELYCQGTQRLETTSTGVSVTGILTATSFSGPTLNTSGISTFYDLRVSNNLTVEGTTTTLDTNVTGVDRLEVNANSNSNTAIVGIQSGTADIVNLFDGSTEVLTVTDGGSVGIGSQIPQAKFVVSNAGVNGFEFNPNFNSNNSIIASYNRSGGGSYSQLTLSASQHIFAQGGTEYGRFNASGNLGIGTDNPGSKLHISGDGAGQNVLRINTSATAISINNHSEFIGYIGNDSGKLFINAGGTQRTLSLKTVGIERLSINSVGNLEQTLATNAQGFKQINANNHYIYNIIDANRSAANDHLLIQQGRWNGKNVAAIKFRAGSDTSNKDDGYITFETSTANNQSEKLRIISDGRVGIKTTSPTAQLTVGNETGDYMNVTGIQVNRPHSLGLQNGVHVYNASGTFNQTASYYTSAFKATGTGGAAFAVSQDAGTNGLGGTLKSRIGFDGGAFFLGQVGIGSAIPNVKLDVFATGGTIAQFGDPRSASFECIRIKNNVAGYPAITNDSTPDTLDLRSMGSVQATIDSNNNDTGNYFRVMANGEGGAGTEIFRAQEDGRVGIGTNNPTSRLHAYNPTNLGNTAGDLQEILKLEGYVANDGMLEFRQVRLSNGTNWETSAFRIQRVIDVTKMGYIDFGTGNGGAGRDIQFGSGNGTIMMHLDSTGKVGIGTNNPQRLLHLQSTGDALARITSADGNAAYLELGDVSDPDGGKIVYDTGSSLEFYTASNPRLRIDSVGRVLIGTTSNRQTRLGTNSFSPNIQIESDSIAAASITRFTDNNAPSRFILQKAKGSIASPTVVADGNQLGQILFSGWDGDTFTNAAQIRAEVDGTPGDDDMPGRLIFATTPDGSTGSQERLRIESNGNLITKGVNNGNPVGIEIRNNDTAAYSHAQLSLTSQNSTTSHIWCDVPNAGMRFRYNSGTTAKFNQSGNFVMANGSGIDFSATGQGTGSMSSELLDDYEEGIATFQLLINSSETSGISYSYNTAPYIKVGRMVWCAISMFATSIDGTTGSIDIQGLPFTDGGGGGYREPAFLAANHGGAGTYVISGALHGNNTKIRLRKNGNVDLDGSDVGGTFWMHGHITYMST